MHDHSHGAAAAPSGWWIILLPFAAAAAIYLAAAVVEGGRGRPWPWARTVCWMLGLALAALTVWPGALSVPELPFTQHVVGHLLIGMVAPLLLVLAAPITLALRSFAVPSARRLSRALRSTPVRLVANPLVAGVLNLGSLWMLYTTPLYDSTSEPFLHLVVMLHFLAVGLLFTAVIVPVDPSPHRWSVPARVVVLTLTLAAHSVLAKTLYASTAEGTGMLASFIQVPGVAAADLQLGAQVMFYGGDLVDLALIGLVLWGWFRSAERLRRRSERMLNGEIPSGAFTAAAPAVGTSGGGI
nr:cytochrome c oxidase assembly protein [uncultured Microbacterium sp.]